MVDGVTTWSPATDVQVDVLAEQVTVSYGAQRDNPGDVYAYQVQVATGEAKAGMDLLAYAVQLAYRSDHKSNGGGAYPPAAVPGMEDDAVIYTDLFFPKCFAYGSSGSPVYITDKVEVDSGDEQRNQRRQYPKHEYKISMKSLNASEVSEIMNLWHVCAGDFIGFLFMDPMDHTSSNTVGALSGDTVAITDQLVASAIGTQSEYDLWKYYQSGGRTTRRRIWYPDLTTLQIAVDGFKIDSWDYSYATHKLSFLQAFPGHHGSITRASDGSITGADFSLLKVGDLVYISNVVNSAYNAAPGGDPARVILANSTTLKVQKYNGTSYGSAAFTDSSVDIVQALPPTGADITAGFWFYVPVRFGDGNDMNSEIKAGLRDSVFADFTDITLREIAE